MDPQWRHLISWYVKGYNSLLKWGAGGESYFKKKKEKEEAAEGNA